MLMERTSPGGLGSEWNLGRVAVERLPGIDQRVEKWRLRRAAFRLHERYLAFLAGLAALLAVASLGAE